MISIIESTVGLTNMQFQYHFISVLIRRIYKFLSSYRTKLSAKLWKVSFGSDVLFFGKTYFRRLPSSTIQIGLGCQFYSKFNSNLIGINRPCMLSTLTKDAEIIIGNGAGFSGTVIGAFKSIRIGNNVKCGANTLITDSDWHPEDSRSGKSKPIVIEDNVWLGEGVKVLKGVTIGENTLIGAGSIVVKSIPANVIAAGNPCKVIRKINA